MEKMTKEEFRQYLLSTEGEELPKFTPEEAFEAGKRGDLSGYDLAGRKVACALLRFFERHPEIDPQQTHYIRAEPEREQVREASKPRLEINEILDEQAKREIDEIGPTGFMFGWALGSVKWLLEK